MRWVEGGEGWGVVGGAEAERKRKSEVEENKKQKWHIPPNDRATFTFKTDSENKRRTPRAVNAFPTTNLITIRLNELKCIDVGGATTVQPINSWPIDLLT